MLSRTGALALAIGPVAALLGATLAVSAGYIVKGALVVLIVLFALVALAGPATLFALFLPPVAAELAAAGPWAAHIAKMADIDLPLETWTHDVAFLHLRPARDAVHDDVVIDASPPAVAVHVGRGEVLDLGLGDLLELGDIVSVDAEIEACSRLAEMKTSAASPCSI